MKDPRIEFIVEKITEIHLLHADKHHRKLCLSWVPEIHEVPLDRAFSETLNISNNMLTRMKMGSGYFDKKCLARREHSMFMGVKYNYSDWEVINLEQLNQ